MIRLLNTHSLAFHEISDAESHKYKYMILSHTWTSGGGISFQDVKCHSITKEPGCSKLKDFCELARSKNYEYIWIDTCCIDKDSTADVQQAINSMYKWYSSADICVTYLEDVGPGHGELARSKWFERGWTLQELIAPKFVEFYDHDWRLIGNKQEHVELLSDITCIPEVVLLGTRTPQSFSVAQCTSWAARRRRTRSEDRAYSLVGLFNITCDAIYGIGEAMAFKALQERIIKNSTDQSIFAWTVHETLICSGLFASSPSLFENCQRIVRGTGQQGFHSDNLGLAIELPTRPFGMNVYTAILDVIDEDFGEKIGTFLARLQSATDQYVRVKSSSNDSRILVGQRGGETTRAIRVQDQHGELDESRAYGFWLRRLEPPGYQDYQTTILSCEKTSIVDHVMLPEASCGTAGIVVLSQEAEKSSSKWSRIRNMKFGFDDDFNPICWIGNLTSVLELCRIENFKKNGETSQPGLFDKKWMERAAEPPICLRRWPAGIYLICGNRDTGLNVQIDDVNVQIAISLCSNRHPGSSTTSEKIWTVDVTAIEEGWSPERANLRFQCTHWPLCVLSWFAVWVCYSEPYLAYLELQTRDELNCDCR